MKFSAITSLIIVAAATTVAAHADTFQFNYSGVGFTAAGTFTGTLTSSPGVYKISSVSGTRNGVTISGLDPAADYADDLLFYPPSNTGTDQTVSYLDNNGIAYLAGGRSYNIYSSDTVPSLVENDDTSPIVFAASPLAATPEPGSLVLLGSGLLTVCGLVRRRVSA